MKKNFCYLLMVISIFGCGGGSDATMKENSTGSTGNTPPASKLSVDQTIFEKFFLTQNGGAFNIYFPRTWTKLESDWSKGYSTHEYISQTPLGTNPIELNEITNKFGLDTSTPISLKNRYTFYLHNGQIVKSKWKDNSYRQIEHAMYSGAKVQLVILADDNKTIVDSLDLEQFESQPLEGLLVNAPNGLFTESFDPRPFLQLKNKNASFLPGAQFIKFYKRQTNNVYTVEECGQWEPNYYIPQTCANGSSDLKAALSKGINVNGYIYSINEGTFSTLDGNKIWITSKYTEAYKFSEYFIEKNNQIYFGFFYKKDTDYGNRVRLNDVAEKSFRRALTE